MKTLILSCALLLVALSFSSVHAQKSIEPKASPMALSKVMMGETYVSVVYSQPHKKDRTIFGELVPFGEVWRFGANEATQFTTNSDIMLADQKLPAGTYSVFCIPSEKNWTLIFNRALGLWGNYNYKAEHDELRVTVPTASTDETWEPFTIKFDKQGDAATMMVMWDNTKVDVPMKLAM